MSCKKIASLLAVLLFSAVACVAQTPSAIIIPGKTMQKILQRIEKKFEKADMQQRQRTLAIATQVADSDSLRTQVAQHQEVCGETGHSHQQAKNHKGPCTWVSLTPQGKVPQSRHSYNPKTGEHVYIHANGTVWQWKEPQKQPRVASNADTVTANRKYPAYW